MNLFFLATFIVILRDSYVNSHGSGAPSSRCDTMMPGHWVSPQESISPFQVIIDKTVIVPGERVNITLRTVRGQSGFKGFLVMVKDGGEENGDGEKKPNPSLVYGNFDMTLSDVEKSQAVHCFNQRNSAMTHVTNDVKESVELSWIAPNLLPDTKKTKHSSASSPQYMERELRVVATFVKDFWTVWTEVEPVGGVRLLLTDTHQLSPKFQAAVAASQKTSTVNEEFRDEPIEIVSGDNFDNMAGGKTNFPLEENSSWTHFKRAWNYVVNLFGSTTSSSQ